ncbi:hypothetical protein [Leucobacter celer]|uniref:hypothetical protein n=1 Tax=Leucobacter celer TaxID=668625 RepID=UPI0006A7AE59|nr:hypothetical protein [Leucobacter celer]
MIRRDSDSRHRGSVVAGTHEHGWYVESRHATSTGYVLYVRCGDCGTRRVDVQERFEAPPGALSVELRSLG